MAVDVVGFIGLGVMGKPMAKNLIKGGHSLVVHSCGRGPVDEVVAAGAKAASSPADVARQASVVITMLPDTPDVELVLTGSDGVVSRLQPRAVVIDMSSISPAATRRPFPSARSRIPSCCRCARRSTRYSPGMSRTRPSSSTAPGTSSPRTRRCGA